MKKSTPLKLENTFFYLFLIFIILFSLINFVSHLNNENTFQNKALDPLDCKNFTYAFSEKVDLGGKEVYIIRSDIYVFPEIKNILCLGRYSNIYTDNVSYFINVYTNTKFINIIIFFFNFTIMITKSFFKLPKKKFLMTYFLFNLYFFLNHFFSINLTSLNFMFIPITSYYFFKKSSDEN
jgi:hypothetical protein